MNNSFTKKIPKFFMVPTVKDITLKDMVAALVDCEHPHNFVVYQEMPGGAWEGALEVSEVGLKCIRKATGYPEEPKAK